MKSCPCCYSEFETPIEIQEAEKFRHGIHKIDIITEDNKVVSMRGEYIDCWPSLKHGEILFFKTEEERDACIKEFFETAEEFKKNLNNK